MVITESDRISHYLADRLGNLKMPGEILAYSMQLDAKRSIVDKITKNGNGVLVGCEAAMNGLSLPQIDHLISWSLPEQVDSYMRRLERFTFQESIKATVLVDPSRMGAIKVLQRQVGQKMVQLNQDKNQQNKRKPKGQNSRFNQKKVIMQSEIKDTTAERLGIGAYAQSSLLPNGNRRNSRSRSRSSRPGRSRNARALVGGTRRRGCGLPGRPRRAGSDLCRYRKPRTSANQVGSDYSHRANEDDHTQNLASTGCAHLQWRGGIVTPQLTAMASILDTTEAQRHGENVETSKRQDAETSKHGTR